MSFYKKKSIFGNNRDPCVKVGQGWGTHGLFVANLVLLSCLKTYVSKIRKMGGWSKRNL